jgi:hypothetical protein
MADDALCLKMLMNARKMKGRGQLTQPQQQPQQQKEQQEQEQQEQQQSQQQYQRHRQHLPDPTSITTTTGQSLHNLEQVADVVQRHMHFLQSNAIVVQHEHAYAYYLHHALNQAYINFLDTHLRKSD